MKATFRSESPGLRRVVRVATNNNFNCTNKEFRQLDELNVANPDSIFFINSNVNTPELLKINDHPYKAVITVNPTLIVRSESVDMLYLVDKAKVAFVRVKYIPDHPEINYLISKLVKDNYAVVVTVQRWNGIEALLNYTKLEHYTFSHNRFRLSGEALNELQRFIDSFKDKDKVFLCDRVGCGCKGCKLCVMLTAGALGAGALGAGALGTGALGTGVSCEMSSINLSSSGICKFNCPDCYAKTMQSMSRAFGYQPIIYDKIKANSKQAGRTEHIKESLEKVRV